MNRQQRRRQANDYADGHQQQFAGVTRQQVLERLADIVVDTAPLFDGGDDGGKVVIGDDHVCRLLGNFRTGSPHGNTDVGAFDGRGVVNTVAGHRHDRIIRLPGANNA